MPLYNEVGDPMPVLQMSDSEKSRKERITALKYPEDEERIFHLSVDDFRIWLYSKEPRESLLLCSTSGINMRIANHLKRKRFGRVTDFIWRLCHG